MNKQYKNRRAWYSLRRTLPPWSAKENLDELVKHLPEYCVDELVVKVDTEEFTHGQPSVRWVKNYQNQLFKIRDRLEEINVRYSLNPWITLGHCDRGRDSRKDLPGLGTMTGHDGVECKCCACPLDPVWRKNIRKIWTMYAETKPHVIWIEDDIRTFNHQPVTYGCFCQAHMKMFSERIGRKTTREDLVAAILKPGKPHPWRKAWLDMQAEIMIETVSFLSGVVHETSPETCIGLMSSGGRIHCIEGRHWAEFCNAAADGTMLYSRPPMGNYSENSLRGLYYSHDSIKLTRKLVPPNTIEQSEVENVPFTQYANSAVFTFLEMAVSIAYGCDGVTLNLFDHCGTPMETEPIFGRMLGKKKKFLNALAEASCAKGVLKGVGLLFHEKYSYEKQLARSAPYRGLAVDDECLMRLFESHGVPTTYDDSPVVAVSGQMLRAFSNEDIKNLLMRGVFLDATAAKIVCDKGFGDLIGMKSVDAPCPLDDTGVFSAEEFFNPEFGGAPGKYLTLTIPDLGGRPNVSRLTPLPGTRIISSIVDPDAKRKLAGMCAYENKLGGRIVTHAIELASAYGIAFNHTFRREQLEGAVRYISRGNTPLLIKGGVYPLGFNMDCGAYSLLGCFNLTLDPWPFVEFEFFEKRRISDVKTLLPSGTWRKSPLIKIKKTGANLILRHEKSFTFENPLFIRIDWR